MAAKYAEIGARIPSLADGGRRAHPSSARSRPRSSRPVPTTRSEPAPVARSGVRRPCSRTPSTAASSRARLGTGIPEAVPKHHRRREEGRERGWPLRCRRCPGPSRGPARTRPAVAGAEAGRRQHPERPGQHRRLVAEDVAEEVLGDDHVEVRRARDELHRRVVDQEVVELDVGVVARPPGSTVSRHRREVSSTFALSTEVTRAPAGAPRPAGGRRRRRHGRSARSRRPSTRRSSWRGLAVAAAVAEVDPAGQLAHHEQVGAGDPLLPQRAGGDQRRARADRPQVGEQPQPLAKAEQALLGARRIGIGRVPLRSADGAEQHRVRVPAGLEHLVGERDPVGVDRGPADRIARRTRSRRSPPAARGPPATISGPIPSPGSRTTSGRRRSSRPGLSAGAHPRLDVEAHVIKGQRLLGVLEDRLGEGSRNSSGSWASSGPRVTVEVNSSGRSGVTGLGSSQQRASANPASSSRRSVSRAGEIPRRDRALEVRANSGPRRDRRDRPRVLGDVSLAPALRDQRPPGANAPRSRPKSRSWSRIQWKVAVEKIRSTGSTSSSSERSAT